MCPNVLLSFATDSQSLTCACIRGIHPRACYICIPLHVWVHVYTNLYSYANITLSEQLLWFCTHLRCKDWCAYCVRELSYNPVCTKCPRAKQATERKGTDFEQSYIMPICTCTCMYVGPLHLLMHHLYCSYVTYNGSLVRYICYFADWLLN